MTQSNSPKRVLIVEDNPLLAYDLEDLLREEGHDPIGPALDLQSGLTLARENQLDGALLDIDLGKDRVWPLARELKNHTVPFAFISAKCNSEALPEEFQDHHCLEKPAEQQEIISLLSRLVAQD